MSWKTKERKNKNLRKKCLKNLTKRKQKNFPGTRKMSEIFRHTKKCCLKVISISTFPIFSFMLVEHSNKKGEKRIFRFFSIHFPLSFFSMKFMRYLEGKIENYCFRESDVFMSSFRPSLMRCNKFLLYSFTYCQGDCDKLLVGP